MHKYSIAHLTSVHPRTDTRIFIKMCSSLAEDGFETNFIVADGLGDELKNNVQIVDAGATQGGRLSRISKTVYKVYKKAKSLDADLYHLHDPELIGIGLLLKSRGKKVIFDAHEDLPKQIMGKPYLSKIAKKILSFTLSVFESITCRFFSGIIAATPAIEKKFSKINSSVSNINNYPVLNELSSKKINNHDNRSVAYVGGITKNRGIEEIVKALESIDDVSLLLGGKFAEKNLKKDLSERPGWEKVQELGFLNRKEMSEVLGSTNAGLVLFHPEENHIEAQPNKMFEYMSAGLPIITSDFPMWKNVVEVSNCGICVDPLNPDEIALAIKKLLNDKELATNMGKNGLQAVKNIYNWDSEKNKLFLFYSRILSN